MSVQQKQVQTQKEQQVLQTNAVQVAFAHLVELPLMDMEMKVRNEMEANEALEERNNDPYDTEHDIAESSNDELNDNETSDASEINDSTADYASADDIPDYLLRQNNEREEREIQISQQNNAYDDLYRQIAMLNLTPHEQEVMEYLLGSLDDNGYLTKDDALLADEMDIYHNIETNIHEVKHLRALLQTLEPIGIGAKDLQDCMLIQLEDPDLQSSVKDIAIEMVKEYFHDFSLRHWKDIQRKLNITEAQLEAVNHLLKRLNPRPGSSLNEYAQQTAPTVVPDFFLQVEPDGDIVISLNKGDIPELRVSESFKQIINEYSGKTNQLSRQQNDELLYARKKVTSAQLFIELMRRRKQTLLGVMHTIATIQADFFKNEDDDTLLIPMTLKDVATRTGVDISTVSRVTSSKYVQTIYGQYPLKYFFSSAFTNEEGEEMSSRQAKALLKKIIEQEDKQKPYSDEKISQLMKEKGQPISRRTVVKYREQLGIPKSSHRKA